MAEHYRSPGGKTGLPGSQDGVPSKRPNGSTPGGTMDTARIAAALINVINFDSSGAGSLPDGWKAGVTGAGSPRWSVERDATAPSAPNVLKQSGSGAFPWCVKEASLADGFVAEKMNPVSERQDQQ